MKRILILTLLLLSIYSQTCSDEGIPSNPCLDCQETTDYKPKDWVRTNVEQLYLDPEHETYSHSSTSLYYKKVQPHPNYYESIGNQETHGICAIRDGYDPKNQEITKGIQLLYCPLPGTGQPYKRYHILTLYHASGGVFDNDREDGTGGAGHIWCPNETYYQKIQVYYSKEFVDRPIITCINWKCQNSEKVTTIGNCIGEPSVWVGSDNEILAGMGVKYHNVGQEFISGLTLGFTGHPQKYNCEECAEGFYNSGNRCNQCDSRCQTCENATECLSCAHNRTGSNCEQCAEGYNLDGGECVYYEEEEQQEQEQESQCETGYLLYNGKCEIPTTNCGNHKSIVESTGECMICTNTCFTCPDAQCLAPFNLQKITMIPNCEECVHSCVPCPEEQKPTEENNNNNPSGCPKLVPETCKEVEVNCVKCKDETMQNRNQEDCSCVEGYYDVKGIECKQCDKSCKTCDNKERCTSCPTGSGKVIDKESGKCVCKESFYEDAQGVCQPCESKCDKCLSKDTCIKCYDANRLMPNCEECKEGYFMKDEVCEKCSENCKECESTNKCTVCPEGRELQGGECVCKSGSYAIDLVQCGSCPSKCPECSGPETCDSCQGNRDINNNCDCLPGQLDIDGQDCKECNKKCKKCINDSNTCDPNEGCSDPMRIFEKECTCPEGYATGPDGSSCIPCTNSDCKHCDKDINKCSACYGDERKGEECKCYPGKFEIGKDQCSQCDVKCETCEDSSENCVTCKDPENRSPPNCDCAEDMWDDNGVCKPQEVCTKIEIQPSKSVCNSFSIFCDECLTEAELKCFPSCANGVCSQSDLDAIEQCRQFNCRVGAPEKCDQDTAACVCDPGFYQVAEDRNDCWPCHSSCETCNGGESNNCLTCEGGVAAQQGECETNEINVNDTFIAKSHKNGKAHIRKNN